MLGRLNLTSTIFCLLLFGNSLAAQETTSLPAQKSALRANGKIAFVSNRDGNDEIYVMNPDGTGQTQLTNNSAGDGDVEPAFSPDGTKIAFTSHRHGDHNTEIYVMNADGTGQTRLTDNAGHDYRPAWSPDGTKIAYIREYDKINVMNADGSGQTTIHTGVYPITLDWSPDGAKIIFDQYNEGKDISSDIFMINTNGSGLTRITSSNGFFECYHSPAFSPDGLRILFGYSALINIFPIEETFSISVMNANGSSRKEIGSQIAFNLDWSPDSTKITFNNSIASSSTDIFVMNQDGSGLVNLTNSPEEEYDPSWGSTLLVSPARAVFDFDGDGKTDISVFRPADRVWYITNSSNNSFHAEQFGLSDDRITPADFDGDGRTDIAVFRDGVWYLQRSQAGFAAIHFGQAGDVPVPADYDGDGRADLVVFRSGFWYILQSSNNQFHTVQFGIASDKTVPADFDGDGKTDIAVYRDGVWYWLRSSDGGFRAAQFGAAADIPVVGDYDGDGKTDLAVFRPSDRNWYVLRSSDNGFSATNWGLAADKPVPGDYDSDGRTDIAVYRDGVWFILKSSNEQFTTHHFGLSSDIPIASANIQ